MHIPRIPLSLSEVTPQKDSWFHNLKFQHSIQIYGNNFCVASLFIFGRLLWVDRSFPYWCIGQRLWLLPHTMSTGKNSAISIMWSRSILCFSVILDPKNEKLLKSMFLLLLGLTTATYNDNREKIHHHVISIVFVFQYHLRLKKICTQILRLCKIFHKCLKVSTKCLE